MANRFDLLWERTQREIPGAEIVLRKNSLLLKVVFGALHWLLRIVTLGRVKSDYSGFATTVCRTIYMPDDFPWWSDYQRYSRLRHELVHLRQFRTWPMPFLGCRGLWLINAAIMGLCYLLVLPVLLTFRAKFEKEGYRESILVRWECGGLRDPAEQARYVAWVVDTFATSKYAWMSTRGRAQRWAEKLMGAVVAGTIENNRDNVDTWVT